MLRTADPIGFFDPREEDQPMQTNVTDAVVTVSMHIDGWILRRPARPVDLEPLKG
jgi:hypothetical protein